MGLATLGGIPLVVDPDSVARSFKMKTAQHDTLGGKVIQVFGTSLGDMTVSGSFGVGGWQERDQFTAQIKKWIQADIDRARSQPLRFSYPSRAWNFLVHVKAYSGTSGEFTHSDREINPTWTLVLFIVEDSTGKVVKGIQDLYISRLMDGIGWKQTPYNGPNQAQVDKLLAPYGGSVVKYLADGANPTGQVGAP
jgi:hypothetical protein